MVTRRPLQSYRGQRGDRKTRSLRHLLVTITVFVVIVYMEFLHSLTMANQPVKPAANGLRSVQGTSKSMRSSYDAVNATTVDRGDIDLAEFAYENQKGERNQQSNFSVDFARIGANWPCFWGETAVGDLDVWKNKWDIYKDGWKYVCGLSYITEPCVVYSLGSSGNMAFEKGLLQIAPHCEVHAFDMKIKPGLISDWFSDNELINIKIKTHEMYIGTKDDCNNNICKSRSIPSIMAELGHTHIDILKMDIEGSEWGIFSPESDFKLNNIGQLQVEVHTHLPPPVNEERLGENRIFELVERLESEGLRLFHKEINWRYGIENCIEYAFIQKEWAPDKKNY